MTGRALRRGLLPVPRPGLERRIHTLVTADAARLVLARLTRKAFVLGMDRARLGPRLTRIAVDVVAVRAGLGTLVIVFVSVMTIVAVAVRQVAIRRVGEMRKLDLVVLLTARVEDDRLVDVFEEGLDAIRIARGFERLAFGFLARSALLRITLCLLYTSPSPRDKRQSRMPSSA